MTATAPPDTATAPAWHTASQGAPAETSVGELSALNAHLLLCARLRGHLFALRCGAEDLRDFIAARLLTTVLLAALLLALSLQVF